MEIPTFSRELTNERAAVPYPHVEVLDKSESLALMLQSIETGNLPIIFTTEKGMVQIALVRASALVLATILKVTRLLVRPNETDEIEVKTVDDIMNVMSLVAVAKE